MDQIIRLQDLSAEEISRLLATNGRRLRDDGAGTAQRCATEIARIKNACDVLKSLHDRAEAA